MEATLTCSHATFSQVFGRQGQLMRASEWIQICVLGPTEAAGILRLSRFAPRNVRNVHARLRKTLENMIVSDFSFAFEAGSWRSLRCWKLLLCAGIQVKLWAVAQLLRRILNWGGGESCCSAEIKLHWKETSVCTWLQMCACFTQAPLAPSDPDGSAA